MGARGDGRPNMSGGRSASTVVLQELNAADRQLLMKFFLMTYPTFIPANMKGMAQDLEELELKIRAGWNGR